jgi:hypothetical protein
MLINNELSMEIKKDELEKLGALHYTPREIAMFLDIPLAIAEEEFNNEKSLLNYYIKRGRLMSETKEHLALIDSAQGGNISASERLEKIRRDKSFTTAKEDIFGSINRESIFHKLQDYIVSGAQIDISNDEALYLDTLRLIDSVERHYGRRETIRLLQKKPFNLTFGRAREMMDEATNLFYSEKNVDKKAMRNKRAEMLVEMATLIKKNAKNANDFKVAGDLLVQASKLQQLDKEEPNVLPKEAYQKSIRIFMLEPEKVGLPSISRKQVLEDIQKLAIPEAQKQRITYEANIEDIIPVNELLENAAKKD